MATSVPPIAIIHSPARARPHQASDALELQRKWGAALMCDPYHNRTSPGTTSIAACAEMKCTETPFEALWLIDIEPFEDARECSAVSWTPEAFAARGLHADIAQCNVAWSHLRGMLRACTFSAPRSKR
jgi:hypothetical protein